MSVAIARRSQDNFSSVSGSKLHRDAQTHCSSLFAGTASIVVRGSEKGNHDLYQQDKINITDLPVSVRWFGDTVAVLINARPNSPGWRIH